MTNGRSLRSLELRIENWGLLIRCVLFAMGCPLITRIGTNGFDLLAKARKY